MDLAARRRRQCLFFFFFFFFFFVHDYSRTWIIKNFLWFQQSSLQGQVYIPMSNVKMLDYCM
jgi:hypothetical protein